VDRFGVEGQGVQASVSRGERGRCHVAYLSQPTPLG
jgi:hypothetical protein